MPCAHRARALHSGVKSWAPSADTHTVLASDLIPETTALVSALGALLTAVTSLVAAVASSKLTRRRMTDECDRRVDELNKTFRAGIRLADQRPRDTHGERWSHLE